MLPLKGAVNAVDCGVVLSYLLSPIPPYGATNDRPYIAHNISAMPIFPRKKRTTLVIRFKYVRIQLFNVNLFTGKNFIHSSCGAHLTAH